MQKGLDIAMQTKHDLSTAQHSTAQHSTAQHSTAQQKILAIGGLSVNTEQS